MKVRVGSRYRFNPVPFDIINPPFGVSKGDVVTVINLPGAPKANTMGMAHVAKDGTFAGMVMTNSLVPVKADPGIAAADRAFARSRKVED